MEQLQRDALYVRTVYTVHTGSLRTTAYCATYVRTYVCMYVCNIHVYTHTIVAYTYVRIWDKCTYVVCKMEYATARKHHTHTCSVVWCGYYLA